jgi:hypothetical protein
MKRFLRIILYVLLLQIGQVSVVMASHTDDIAETAVTESVLETDGYSSYRYSDFDSPCGIGTVSAPTPVFTSSERGSDWSGNAKRVRTSYSAAHYILFRYDKLLNRRLLADYDSLLSCQSSGTRSLESRLFFLCALKS